MIKNIILIIFVMFFQSCATWYGIKKDSKEAWEATKETTSEVATDIKKSVDEITKQRQFIFGKYIYPNLNI